MTEKNKDQSIPDYSNELSQCFSFLSPEEMEYLNQRKTQLVYEKGENLFKQGAFAPNVLLVVSGLVRTYIQTGVGKQYNIRLTTSGDYLAFSAVLGESTYSYSAIAMKTSVVCMIDTQVLMELLQKNQEFSMRITSRNCRNEVHLLDLIKNLTYKQMRGKLATTLLYLSSEEFLKEDVYTHLSRQDVANFAAISLESTVKFLKEFEKEEIIQLKGKDIKIINDKMMLDVSKRG